MTDIKRITEIDNEIIDAIEKLIPQLTPNYKLPSINELELILNNNDTHLLGLYYENKIVGILTIIVNKMLTGNKAWIEDVVIDSYMRGKNMGEILVKFAIDYTIKNLNVTSINLTSAPDRIAANKLYKKVGFIQRNTNIYRFTIEN